MTKSKLAFDAIQLAKLTSKIEASAHIADRLTYSIGRALSHGIAPLTIEKLERLTDSDMEIMDAYLYRYGSLISNIQDDIFKAVGELEQEPVSSMSNRDKANLMERIGALPSAETFASLAIIRNKLMHEYPEEAQKQLERINFITEEAPNLVDIFIGIVLYCEKFGTQISLEKHAHLLEATEDVCKKCKQIPCICESSSSIPRG